MLLQVCQSSLLFLSSVMHMNKTSLKVAMLMAGSSQSKEQVELVITLKILSDGAISYKWTRKVTVRIKTMQPNEKKKEICVLKSTQKRLHCKCSVARQKLKIVLTFLVIHTKRYGIDIPN